MKTIAQTTALFICLTLIQNVCRAQPIRFKVDDPALTAKAGSCAEIKCSVPHATKNNGGLWFWLKNAVWDDDSKDFDGTIVYSSDNSSRPVSPDYAHRVTYVGSPDSEWSQESHKRCSILICDLKQGDSGNYSFRLSHQIRDNNWHTDKVNLTVTENPCPLTFEVDPPVAQESGNVTLNCSTLSSCPTYPQITDFSQLSQRSISSHHSHHQQQQQQQQKITTVTFPADWKDHGKVFSCQTQDETDMYLTQNRTLTVEYAPRDVLAGKKRSVIKEGDDVSLTCSAKGHPEPTFTWWRNSSKLSSDARFNLQSIKISDSGTYHCEAENKHDTKKSQPVEIDVTYAPTVKLQMSSPTESTEVVQGYPIKLTCQVIRSNPQPHLFFWYKDSKQIQNRLKDLSIQHSTPEDRGLYRCEASNSVGHGRSANIMIKVKYRPRKTNVSTKAKHVELGQSLTLTCEADANPAPERYCWSLYSRDRFTDLSRCSRTLELNQAQKSDQACYVCNATNTLGTGENSGWVCIKVHFPPTNLKLTMDREVKEGQPIRISCTVESQPPSLLTLRWTSDLHSQASEWIPYKSIKNDQNTLNVTLTATPGDAGFYSCSANNGVRGTETSTELKLVVKYQPKVNVRPETNTTLKENASLTLLCEAQSYPEVQSRKWQKMIMGKKAIIGGNQTFHVKSVSPSDSGVYSCKASNEMGTGESKNVEVKVEYAPKQTNILITQEKQQPDGTSSVTLSCSSHSEPPIKQYSWYKKANEKGGRDTKLSQRQNYTVFSHNPGAYYCIAKNEIDQCSSDPVHLFDRSLMKALQFVFLGLIILLIIFVLFFVYRRRRNKAAQQGAANTPPCSGFMGWWNCTRQRNRANEPSRSRDDILPDQPCHPNGRRRQPRPDITPAANINSVYSTVNLPARTQDPPAQNPIRQKGGCTEDESLNYTTINFEKNKQTKAEAAPVYAMVSKKKQLKKNEQENLDEYENVKAAKSPNPQDDDSDTSEDELEINYTQVNFKAKPGHQRADRHSSSDTSSDSSTSDEEGTQYSLVKI